MKTRYYLNKTLQATMLVLAVFFTSCSDDDDNGPMLTGDSKTYSLNSVSNPGIDGNVTFSELSDGKVSIDIQLNGTSSGTHPAHIHYNTAAEGGGIAISLTPVDGSSGTSTTIVNMTDDGMMISYEELLDFDGYVNVHASAADLATLIAQGDIGQNELIGNQKMYTLAERDVDGISGSVTFEERRNGEALAIIQLSGTPDNGMHPAHIHENTAAEGGAIAFTFTPINGTTGMSMTNVAMLDDGTPITFDDLLQIDGYVNVHLSMEDLGTLVAQGDIGQNELTGNSVSYMLNEKDIMGVSGEATFSERVNGETLVTLALTGTAFTGDHPSHIHLGSVAEAPGAIAVTLTSVNTMGMSMTNVTMTDASESLNYQDLITFDGYINVHLSASELGVLVAQGDIGANAN